MDRFEAMGAFVTVVERGGFAPAARTLGVSPSAVTRMVGGLETRLGVRLLHRTTRAVHLTDQGTQFLERARRILADLDDAERLAESGRMAPAGRLVISAPVMFGRLHVAPLVGRYAEHYPAVVVDLMLSDRLVNLVEEGVDLAVRIGELADSSSIARRVGATRRVIAGSVAYLARAGAPRGPGDLARHRVIACTALAPEDRWRLGGGRQVGISPAFVTNSAEVALAQAVAGGGLVQLLSYQVADAVRQGAMRLVLQEFAPPPLPIHFVYPSSRLMSAKLRALLELAAAECDWSFAGIEA